MAVGYCCTTSGEGEAERGRAQRSEAESEGAAEPSFDDRRGEPVASTTATGENREEDEEEEEQEDLEELRKACINCGACEKYHVFVDSPAALRAFRGALLRWFSRHRRRLPWRGDPPPYTSWATTRSATTGNAEAAAAAAGASTTGGASLASLTSQQPRRRNKQAPLKGQMSLTSFFRVKPEESNRHDTRRTSVSASRARLPASLSPRRTSSPVSRSLLSDSFSHVDTANAVYRGGCAAESSGALVAPHSASDDLTGVCGGTENSSSRSAFIGGYGSAGAASTVVDRNCRRSSSPTQVGSSCTCSSTSAERPVVCGDGPLDGATGSSSTDTSVAGGSTTVSPLSSGDCGCSNLSCCITDRSSSSKPGKEGTRLEVKTLGAGPAADISPALQQQQCLHSGSSASSRVGQESAAVGGGSGGEAAATETTTTRTSAAKTGAAPTPATAATAEESSEAAVVADVGAAAAALEEAAGHSSGADNLAEAGECMAAEGPQGGATEEARDSEDAKGKMPAAAPQVTPYGVWVSEVMLQQTQVTTVIDYWMRWMQRWPSVEKLAIATEEEVQHMWSGLGYYRRARQLLQGAREVVAKHGRLPQETKKLLTIPGIGPYTAGAIRALAYNLRAAAVDGNVTRVLSRLAGFAAPADGRPLAAAATEMMPLLLHRRRAAASAEALIELGATLCTPRAPACAACPVRDFCRTRKEAENLCQRGKLHHDGCHICAVTARGAVSPEDYPLPKGSLKRDHPEEIYAVLLVVYRQPSHEKEEIPRACDTRSDTFRSNRRNNNSDRGSGDSGCNWSSDNSSRTREACAAEGVPSTTPTTVKSSEKRRGRSTCSSFAKRGRSLGSLRGKAMKQSAAASATGTARLHMSTRECQGRRCLPEQQMNNFMLLLRRRPSTGLLAGQLEVPSTILLRGGTQAEKRDASCGKACPRGPAEKKHRASSRVDAGTEDRRPAEAGAAGDAGPPQPASAGAGDGEQLPIPLRPTGAVGVCGPSKNEVASAQNSVSRKAAVTECRHPNCFEDAFFADKKLGNDKETVGEGALPGLEGEPPTNTRSRKGNSNVFVKKRQQHPELSIERFFTGMNGCNAERGTSAGEGASSVGVKEEKGGRWCKATPSDEEKHGISARLLTHPTTKEALSELLQQLNIYAAPTPPLQYAGHVRHIFSHVTHNLLVFVCEVDPLFLKRRRFKEVDDLTTLGAETNNAAHFFSIQAARAACHCTYTQKVLDVFEEFCKKASATQPWYTF